MSLQDENTWQYQAAKAKLSQVMDCVQKTGMQWIVRNRREVYVVLTLEKYKEATRPTTSLLDFFLQAPCPEIDLDLERRKETARQIDL